MSKIIIENKINEFLDKLHKNEENTLTDIERFVLTKMDFYVPVLSGQLKSQNEVKRVKKYETQFRNFEDYAGFIEKGTRNQVAQPFITPSIFNHIKEIEEIAKRGLSNGFR